MIPNEQTQNGNLNSQILEIRVNPSACPHIKVKILGTEITALLDSGAGVSVMSSRNIVEAHGLTILKSNVKVCTADDTPHTCLGYVNVPYTLGTETRVVPTLIVPEIRKPLILGMDFWEAFQIRPVIASDNSIRELELTWTSSLSDNPRINCLQVEEKPQKMEKDRVSLFIHLIKTPEQEIVANSTPEVDSSLDLPGLELPEDPNQAIENVETEHTLSTDEQHMLKEALRQFDCTSEQNLGKTTFIEHEIELIEGGIMKDLPMYRYSPKIWEKIQEELERWKRLQVIEECNTEFASPLVPVRKANGKIRVCLDSRRINSITRKDAYPMRNMSEIFHRLKKAKYFSIVDLKDAYFQIPLKESSRNYTAFRTPKGLFRFRVVPFGLKNAPFTMNRLMNLAIKFDLEPNVFIYLDDIIIATETFAEHIHMLNEVAFRLKKAGLTISVEKSRFCRKQVRYLGYLLTESGLSIDAAKLEPILNYPRPKTVRDVRRLMGLMGFYQKFINHYSHVTSPITDLLKKSKKFKWTDEAENSLNELKSILTSAPVLANPDYTRPFIIETDASQLAVGAALLQEFEEGKRIVGYYSKKLTNTQRKYSATEKECLAVLLAIENFRHYIEGSVFTVITDCKSITWLFSVSAANANSRLLRWALKLQSYDFTLQYRKGKDNVLADCLSRITALSVADDEYNQLIDKIVKQPEKYKNFMVRGSRIYKHMEETRKLGDKRFDWKYYPYKTERHEIIRMAHEPAHLGYDKTLNNLKERYFWPRMAAETKKYCNECVPCKTSKGINVNPTPPMGSQKQFCDYPWQFLTFDYVGPFPPSGKTRNTCLLVVTDVFSKFILVQPFRQATALSLVQYVEQNIFLMFGVPEMALTDNGPQFISREFKALLNRYGVKHWLTPSYHPQTNNTERVNKVITTAIRATLKGNHRQWTDHIYEIASAIRNSIHDTTKYSPFYLTFGRNMVTHGEEFERMREANSQAVKMMNDEKREELYQEIRKNLTEAYNKQSKYYNLRSNKNAPTYVAGERVLKKHTVLSDKSKDYCAKLGPKYTEAYVKQVLGDSYELVDKDNNILGIFHANFLKKF